MFFRILLLPLVFAFLAGCAGGDEPADPPASTPTSDVEATPTTEATPAPTPTARATTEPTPSTEPAAEVSDEDAAAAVHTRFMTELFDRDERIDGEGDRILELAAELTTGPLLARFQSDTPQRIAAGELIVGPGYLSNIRTIGVVGDVANIVDCSQDRTEGHDAAGELTIAADDFFKLRSTRLVRIDGSWFVEEFFTGGDDRCDLDDS